MSSDGVRPAREVRAVQSQTTLRVYQAFGPEIAGAAVSAQRFAEGFKRDRMTWVKPSFAWMMYRSGWATRAGQEQILAIEIKRTGFDWALEHACLARYEREVHRDVSAWRAQLQSAPVRVQWDPERSIDLRALPWRAIQVGLIGDAVDLYVDEWIVAIEDITALAKEVRRHVEEGHLEEACSLVPAETPYHLTPRVATLLGASRAS